MPYIDRSKYHQKKIVKKMINDDYFLLLNW